MFSSNWNKGRQSVILGGVDAEDAVPLETAEAFIARKKAAVGREFNAKDIGRLGKHRWRLEAGTYRQQSNLPEKVLVLERLRLVQRADRTSYPGGAQDGDIEYRFGYYTVAPGPRRWYWGQYSPFIPSADLAPLLAQARTEGTLRPADIVIVGNERTEAEVGDG
jgi:hypothetical protein